MSATEVQTQSEETKSRKRNADVAEIEIDVGAPEPPSKKALRKAKRAKTSTTPAPASKPTEVAGAKPTAEHKPLREDQKRSQYGIWIGNLSFATTKDDLANFLTKDSSNVISEDHITRIHLPLGPPKFGKESNKGFAYVDFSDQESLDKALELSEALLSGRRVLIKNARDFDGRPEPKTTKVETPAKASSKRIFVGNLDFDTAVEDLEEHFGACGPILHTHMATFEDSGKCKGYAWIEFEQLASAESAMRGWMEPRRSEGGSSRQRIWLNKMNGRKLRMEFAEDKATRYQKRFGKNAKTAASDDAEANEQQEPIQEVNDSTELPLVKEKSERRAKKKSVGKYTDETVQRLTGAIIESKGQRTVFE